MKCFQSALIFFYLDNKYFLSGKLPNSKGFGIRRIDRQISPYLSCKNPNTAEGKWVTVYIVTCDCLVFALRICLPWF